MSELRDPFHSLERDIIATLIGAARGENQPTPYSIAPGVEALIRKYEIALRPVPLDRDEVREEWPQICPVCHKAIVQGGCVYELRSPSSRRRDWRAHIECVVVPTRNP